MPAEEKVDTEGLLERRLKLLTSVLAPTTVLTALLFYYGYVATNTQYAYFGISLSTLGLSNQDFLLQSIAALYIPLGVLLFALLVSLWGHAGVKRLLTSHGGRQAARRGGLVAAGVGILALLRGAVGVVVPDIARHEALATTPLCLGLGVCTLAYARYVLLSVSSKAGDYKQSTSWVEQASTVIVSALVILSLFWAANSFAGAYGRGVAASQASQLEAASAVVLDTKERLFIAYPGLDERTLPSTDKGSFRFRYRGLRLLVESGGRLFLLPDQWRPEDGATLVVRDDANVRLQFYRG